MCSTWLSRVLWVSIKIVFKCFKIVTILWLSTKHSRVWENYAVKIKGTGISLWLDFVINIFHGGNHNSLLTHIQCTSIPYYFTAINMSLLKTSKVFKVIYIYAISQHAIKFHLCRTGNKSRFYCFFIRYNRELSVWVTMLTQILDYVCKSKKYCLLITWFLPQKIGYERSFIMWPSSGCLCPWIWLPSDWHCPVSTSFPQCLLQLNLACHTTTVLKLYMVNW